jgi:hypothetical protein
MKQETLVKQFENNNEVYVKITKAFEEKVHSILLDRKELLWRAVLCIIESMRKDPDKYGPLIYYNDDNNVSSIPPQTTISPIAAYYNRPSYPSSYTNSQGQQDQQDYLTEDSFKQGYIDMLREEAEKLFTSLEKMLLDEVIDQYVSNTPSPSLPMLPAEQRQIESERN